MMSQRTECREHPTHMEYDYRSSTKFKFYTCHIGMELRVAESDQIYAWSPSVISIVQECDVV